MEYYVLLSWPTLKCVVRMHWREYQRCRIGPVQVSHNAHTQHFGTVLPDDSLSCRNPLPHLRRLAHAQDYWNNVAAPSPRYFLFFLRMPKT